MNLVSQTSGWTGFPQRIFPSRFIVLAVAVNNQGFLGMRQDYFGGGIFGGEAALNFYPLVKAQFIGEEVLANARYKNYGYYEASQSGSLRDLAMAAHCGRIGMTCKAKNRITTKIVVSRPPSGP